MVTPFWCHPVSPRDSTSTRGPPRRERLPHIPGPGPTSQPRYETPGPHPSPSPWAKSLDRSPVVRVGRLPRPKDVESSSETHPGGPRCRGSRRGVVPLTTWTVRTIDRDRTCTLDQGLRGVAPFPVLDPSPLGVQWGLTVPVHPSSVVVVGTGLRPGPGRSWTSRTASDVPWTDPDVRGVLTTLDPRPSSGVGGVGSTLTSTGSTPTPESGRTQEPPVSSVRGTYGVWRSGPGET